MRNVSPGTCAGSGLLLPRCREVPGALRRTNAPGIGRAWSRACPEAGEAGGASGRAGAVRVPVPCGIRVNADDLPGRTRRVVSLILGPARFRVGSRVKGTRHVNAWYVERSRCGRAAGQGT